MVPSPIRVGGPLPENPAPVGVRFHLPWTLLHRFRVHVELLRGKTSPSRLAASVPPLIGHCLLGSLVNTSAWQSCLLVQWQSSLHRVGVHIDPQRSGVLSRCCRKLCDGRTPSVLADLVDVTKSALRKIPVTGPSTDLGVSYHNPFHNIQVFPRRDKQWSILKLPSSGWDVVGEIVLCSFELIVQFSTSYPPIRRRRHTTQARTTQP